VTQVPILRFWRKMNRKKKVLSILASALIFSVAGAGQAQAADIAVTGDTDWLISTFTGAPPVEVSNRFILDGTYTIDVTDYQLNIDRYTVYANGEYVGVTTPFTYDPAAEAATPAEGWADSRFSRGTFVASSPTITIFTTPATDASSGGSMAVRFTRASIKVRNALRLDAAGTTTEKNNVVSCTPGKYTFLNGGSTAEASNVQGYVYTLLVNGKAVSTLSSDNFRSVPSHLFPTIVGNMAGTATLEGATWNLAGMSNYSAACQVYATQSGANTQSVTTEAHDSVALAAAAEAAAKIQASKNMIADWAASNDELAKKYRDNRLAGKP
jgi:hypothetical protein